MSRDGIVDPGIKMNRESFGDSVDNHTIKGNVYDLIFGSETSGGMAVILSENTLPFFIEYYRQPVNVIGHVTAEGPGRLKLTP
jgi:hypothetical protein